MGNSYHPIIAGEFFKHAVEIILIYSIEYFASMLIVDTR